jgi:hypothetical protein
MILSELSYHSIYDISRKVLQMHSSLRNRILQWNIEFGIPHFFLMEAQEPASRVIHSSTLAATFPRQPNESCAEMTVLRVGAIEHESGQKEE